jgi:hypothetical protein
MERLEPTASDPQAVDLKALLDAYERSLIVAALEMAGDSQRRAAELLGVLPTTLHEKMKRLGVRGGRRVRSAAHPEGLALLHWRGSVPPGGTLELRGLLGRVRIETGNRDGVEVSATRRGPGAVLAAIEVKVVEHPRGVVVSAVHQGLDPVAPRAEGKGSARAGARPAVDLLALVPTALRVVATTVDGDIEIRGPAGNVEAGTSSGRVRFLPAPPLPEPGPPAPAGRSPDALAAVAFEGVGK